MDHRTVIMLSGREKNPVYVYNNDIHYCKALAVKIKFVATPEIMDSLQTSVKMMSKIYRASQFNTFISCSKSAYEERARKLKAF